jgi:hypothetical protein
VFTHQVGALSNDFFTQLLDMSTHWQKSAASEGVYEGGDRSTGKVKWTATPVDMIFGSHSELRAIAEVYGSKNGRQKFADDFIRAWNKVMIADRFELKKSFARPTNRARRRPEELKVKARALQDSVVSVRLIAAWSLVDEPGLDAPKLKAQALQDPAYEVRSMAAQSLHRESGPEVLKLKDLALDSPDAYVRRFAVESLKYESGPEARRLKEKAMRDADPTIREAAQAQQILSARDACNRLVRLQLKGLRSKTLLAGWPKRRPSRCAGRQVFSRHVSSILGRFFDCSVTASPAFLARASCRQ